MDLTVAERPRLIDGAMFVDDRGFVGAVNAFDLAGLRRFYVVGNHAAGFVRAWHAHRRERKYVTVVAGTALVCTVKIDDWERPARDLAIERHVMLAARPAVLGIPGGYAHGTMTLTADTRLVFFSDCSLEESLQDDVRYEARYWDPWTVRER